MVILDCVDYKLTINQASPLEQYTIPRAEDLFTALSGGSSFSKPTSRLWWIKTPSSISPSTPTRECLHTIAFPLEWLPRRHISKDHRSVATGVNACGSLQYLDDILVTGINDEEHLWTLDTVLTRLRDAGLRLKRNKCEFLQKEVHYLGHLVDV